MCLTQNRRSKEIKVYFVSDKFNAALDTSVSEVPVHFIYSPTHDDRVTIEANIENAAHVILDNSQVVEEQYDGVQKESRCWWVALQYCGKQFSSNYNIVIIIVFISIARSSEDDPLCRLAKLHKIRICTQVLNSSFYKNSIVFLPNENLLIVKCQKMTVRLVTESASQGK